MVLVNVLCGACQNARHGFVGAEIRAMCSGLEKITAQLPGTVVTTEEMIFKKERGKNNNNENQRQG
jgi:hypothetical protein